MRRTRSEPPGAPAWVLTYGDMMSLLLVFFIMLVAMSELRNDEKFRAIMEAVQTAFGKAGGGTLLPVKNDPASLTQKLDQMRVRQISAPVVADTQDPGIEGKHLKVTKVREGMRFAVGGYVTFEPGSADLSERGKARLEAVARLFAGYTNKIELRGHAASAEVQDARAFATLTDLAYARTQAVERYLVGQCQIAPGRIRLVSCGDREPLVKRVYSAEELEPNRRVEIVVSEARVDDFTRVEDR